MKLNQYLKLNMETEFTLTEIKEALVKSVVTFDPDYFKPYLFSPQVECEATNKKVFFRYFKRMVCTAEASTIGKLSCKIESSEATEGILQYSFYDEKHLHPRLIINLKETQALIQIEVMPF